MRRWIALLVVAAFVVTLSACANNGPVYPEPVFTEHPKITKIAVAPFIMPEKAVMMPSKKFTAKSFKTSDGATIHYSVDFAMEYARGLAKFKGVEVTMPAEVERRWMQSMKAGKEKNPMASPAAAREIGASLGCDAILFAEVLAWDAFKPDLTMNWQLLATAQGGGGTGILDTERAGTGGQAYVDYTRVPVFSQNAALNAEDEKTKMRLAEYGRVVEDFHPYRDPTDFIRHQPWPRYLHFAAWATMSDAYDAHRPAK